MGSLKLWEQFVGSKKISVYTKKFEVIEGQSQNSHILANFPRAKEFENSFFEISHTSTRPIVPKFLLRVENNI